MSPVEAAPAWPGMSAEASHGGAESAEAERGIADDSASWQADRDSLQRALNRAVAQQIDPSQRPTWTATPEGAEPDTSTMPVHASLLQGVTAAMAFLRFVCHTAGFCSYHCRGLQSLPPASATERGLQSWQCSSSSSNELARNPHMGAVPAPHAHAGFSTLPLTLQVPRRPVPQMRPSLMPLRGRSRCHKNHMAPWRPFMPPQRHHLSSTSLQAPQLLRGRQLPHPLAALHRLLSKRQAGPGAWCPQQNSKLQIAEV